jgi:putative membrane protein
MGRPGYYVDCDRAFYKWHSNMWWYTPYPHMIGDGWRSMPFHGVFALALLILIIVAIIALGRSLWDSSVHGTRRVRRSLGLDVLEERYAIGEIERDEYLQKKRDLSA